TVTGLTYVINSQGTEEFVFGTEFTKDGILCTSDNADHMILPFPPRWWVQVFTFTSGKKSTRTDESLVAVAEDSKSETPPGYSAGPESTSHSAAVRIALDRIDSLYELHKKGVRSLVDNGLETMRPPGACGVEKYWERKDITFLAALQSGDLTDVQKAWRQAAKADMRTLRNYVRSLPFWRIRIAHWFVSCPKKWPNVTIEEQIAKKHKC
ncbi:MAG: hypothetical protein Q4G59_13150, partial [Planctomycetia bacterium]|nr:hypothetical protein [Planctomycetia bacterium]